MEKDPEKNAFLISAKSHELNASLSEFYIEDKIRMPLGLKFYNQARAWNLA